MLGERFPSLIGATIEELVLYAYDGTQWNAVPFQVDEVDDLDEFVVFEDGLLDANDEIVFMAFDAGISTPSNNWANDCQSRLNVRYRINITDPLAQEVPGWVYLYRSQTLDRSEESYISWDETEFTQTVTALNYTTVFSNAIAGIHDLSLNGSDDLLDRQKIFLQADVQNLGTVLLDEASVAGFLEAQGVSTEFNFVALGPVRAASERINNAFGYTFYSGQAELRTSLPLTDFNLPGLGDVHFEFLRISLNWLNPFLTGMAPAVYYDLNTPNGVEVDGDPDSVPITPVVRWFQVSGAIGGLVNISTIDEGNGSLRNHYVDDFDSPLGYSPYGDAGFVILSAGPDNSIGTVEIKQRFYMLPANSDNVGETYAVRTDIPLSATTSVETYGGLGCAVYMPSILR